MTSRLIYPEAGILYATSTVKIWIYRPGGLRPVTFLCVHTKTGYVSWVCGHGGKKEQG